MAPGRRRGAHLHLRRAVGQLLRPVHPAARPRQAAGVGDHLHVLLAVRPGRLRPARRVLDPLHAAVVFLLRRAVRSTSAGRSTSPAPSRADKPDSSKGYMQISESSRPNCSSAPDGGRRSARGGARRPGPTATLACQRRRSSAPRACDVERVEVPLDRAGRPRRRSCRSRCRVDGAATGLVATSRYVAEPGWTVWMISHFHYDPVWWNTQAAYTAMWDDLPGQAPASSGPDFQHTGFALVDAHLETARRDPDYKFVLAEVDYLKPYWDAHPRGPRVPAPAARRGPARDHGRHLQRAEHQPDHAPRPRSATSCTASASSATCVGGDPHTAWQLDVFGHDPQFPGLAADAGLTSSSWARGPHHQWGPMLSSRTPRARLGRPVGDAVPRRVRVDLAVRARAC